MRYKGWYADCNRTAKSVLMCDGKRINSLIVSLVALPNLTVGCLKCHTYV